MGIARLKYEMHKSIKFLQSFMKFSSQGGATIFIFVFQFERNL